MTEEKQYTEEEQRTIDQINQMGQEDMARLWRFAPAGHSYFDKRKPFYAIFEKKFKGFTPGISKKIGW